VLLKRISKQFDQLSVQAFVEKTRRLLTSSLPIIVVPGVVLVIAFLAIFSLRDVLPFTPDKLTKDPLAMAKLPFFYGIFSNLGIMLWASAAAINFAGAALLRSEPRKTRFLFVSGIFTFWLALDDLLMFHETVFPLYLNIREDVIYIGYFFIIVIYLIYFLRDIYLFTDYTLLAAALAAFGSSMLIDLFWGFVFAEDGAKFLGIVLWVVYYFRSVNTLLSERMRTGEAFETRQND